MAAISPSQLGKINAERYDINVLEFKINQALQDADDPLATRFAIDLEVKLPRSVADQLILNYKHAGWAEVDCAWIGKDSHTTIILSRNLSATSTGPGGRD